MAGRNTVVVLGGRAGGLVAARRLLLDPGDRVVLIDKAPDYLFTPSLLWVLNGTRGPERITARRARLRRAGIEVLQAEVTGIDLARRSVKTAEADVGFDRLVIALGADLDPGGLPGFTGAAHNLYTLGGVTEAAGALRRLDSGRVVLAVSRLPFKCPAAPYEAAFAAPVTAVPGGACGGGQAGDLAPAVVVSLEFRAGRRNGRRPAHRR